MIEFASVALAGRIPPVRVSEHDPVLTSQTLTLRSVEPVTSRAPNPMKARLVTRPWCPVSTVEVMAPGERWWSCAVLSRLPEARTPASDHARVVTC